MSGFASVQAVHMRVDRVADGALQLRDGAYRAVLDVAGVPFSLLGEGEREALLASYRAFLNALAHPIQIIVRTTPLDLDGWLDRLAAPADPDVPLALRALARDHAAFLRALAQERTLLERRHYVVVPGEDAPADRRWGWARPGARAVPDHDAALRRLAARCEHVLAGLRRCGLAARRLDTAELAALLYACWRPEGARDQRLRGLLDDVDRLAVVARREVERAS